MWGLGIYLMHLADYLRVRTYTKFNAERVDALSKTIGNWTCISERTIGALCECILIV